MIRIFRVAHQKIDTELSVSKIIFYEIVLCHVKYIEIDAFCVYVPVTGKTSGKTVFLTLVTVREKV